MTFFYFLFCWTSSHICYWYFACGLKLHFKWFQKSWSQITEHVNMYFFLLTKCSDYLVFDEALTSMVRLKKSNSNNYKKRNILEAAFRQYSLESAIVLSWSILIVVLISLKILLGRTIVYHMYVLFYSSCPWHW